MVMTYDSLVRDVTQYLNTTDPVTIAQIPNFIYLTHQEICRTYVNIGYVVYVNGTFIAGAINGGSVVPKPDGWRRDISFTCGIGDNFNNSNQLYKRTFEYCKLYWPDATQTGVPAFYADYDYQHWLIVPTPTLAYPFQVGFVQMPTPVTVNNQMNWLTEFAPDALLWGTLCKAIPFLKDDERIPIWQKYYEDARASLDVLDKANFVDRASYRGAD